MGASVFKPFVVSCRQFYGLEKDFFPFTLLQQLQSLHHPTLRVTHTMVHHASDLLKSWHLDFLVIEAVILALFLLRFCCGLSLKGAGHRHHLSVCVAFPVLPYLVTAMRFAHPRPMAGGKSKRQLTMSDNTQTNLGEEAQYFRRGDGRYCYSGNMTVSQNVFDHWQQGRLSVRTFT